MVRTSIPESGTTEPHSLLCPLTHVMYRDPTVVESGNTYECSAIVSHWEQRGVPHDPLNNVELSARILIPNWCKRREVQCFLDEHPGYLPQGWATRDVPAPEATPRLSEVLKQQQQQDHELGAAAQDQFRRAPPFCPALLYYSLAVLLAVCLAPMLWTQDMDLAFMFWRVDADRIAAQVFHEFKHLVGWQPHPRNNDGFRSTDASGAKHQSREIAQLPEIGTLLGGINRRHQLVVIYLEKTGNRGRFSSVVSDTEDDCWNLSLLASASVANSKDIIKAGGIVSLMSVVKSYKGASSAQTAAIFALRSLAIGSESNKRRLLEAGMMDTIIKVSEERRLEQVQLACCMALWDFIFKPTNYGMSTDVNTIFSNRVATGAIGFYDMSTAFLLLNETIADSSIHAAALLAISSIWENAMKRFFEVPSSTDKTLDSKVSAHLSGVKAENHPCLGAFQRSAAAIWQFDREVFPVIGRTVVFGVSQQPSAFGVKGSKGSKSSRWPLGPPPGA